jgi:hypothetical protein
MYCNKSRGYQRLNTHLTTPVVLLFYCVWALSSLKAQSLQKIQFPFDLPFTIEETPYYTFNPLDRQTSLRMSYAKSEILNPEAWKNVNQEKEVYEIQLVYTKYPRDFDKWLTDYDWLLESRLNELFKLDPSLNNPGIRWRIILQTKCSDAETAKEMYHGIVIKYKPRKAWTAKIRDGYGKQMELVHRIVEGDTMPTDTVVLRAFNRKQDWKKMLVIMDWTGSMYEYSSQLVYWHKQNIARDLIKHMVLFNDGDDNKYKGQARAKTVGKTGGIYSMDVYSLDNMYQTLEKAMRAGNGGDAPENNLEAILKGLKFYSYCEEVVLIADNKAPPRDMALIKKIKRPVHIILCGANPAPPDLSYLNIAYLTGGSISTMQEEIRFTGNTQETIRFTIGKYQFTAANGEVKRDVVP